MRKNAMKAALLGAALALVMTSPARAAEYQLTVIQSMSGALAFVGEPLVSGVKLAVEHINERKLLGEGNTLKVNYEDDETNRGQAVSLIKRHALNKDVLAIMGPTTASVSIAGAQAANEEKIVALVTTNSPEIAKTGPYGFRLSQGPDVAMEVIGKYTVENLKVKNCVMIGVLDSAAYVEQSQAYHDYITARDVKVLAREGIKSSDTDFAALAAKVVAMKPECIFISSIAPQAGNLMVQLRQAGLDPATKITGMGSMNSPDLMKTGGAAVEGLYLIADWIPGGTTPDGAEFARAYKARYGSDPDNFAAMGYSGMRILAEAVRAAGPNPTRDKVRDTLANTKNQVTVLGSGTFHYDENRAPIYGTNVIMVKDGQFVMAPK